jgi:hypothetical protein
LHRGKQLQRFGMAIHALQRDAEIELRRWLVWLRCYRASKQRDRFAERIGAQTINA